MKRCTNCDDNKISVVFILPDSSLAYARLFVLSRKIQKPKNYY